MDFMIGQLSYYLELNYFGISKRHFCGMYTEVDKKRACSSKVKSEEIKKARSSRPVPKLLPREPPSRGGSGGRNKGTKTAPPLKPARTGRNAGGGIRNN